MPYMGQHYGYGMPYMGQYYGYGTPYRTNTTLFYTGVTSPLPAIKSLDLCTVWDKRWVTLHGVSLKLCMESCHGVLLRWSIQAQRRGFFLISYADCYCHIQCVPEIGWFSHANSVTDDRYKFKNLIMLINLMPRRENHFVLFLLKPVVSQWSSFTYCLEENMSIL